LEHLKERYVAALAEEVKAVEAPWASGNRVSTVYFGGGTPSLLKPSQVEQLIECCDQRFGLMPDAEISLEANPETLTPEHLRNLSRVGVNRLSIGVQSFDEVILHRLGRIHSAARAIESYEWARQAGFDNINIDLIYGLPEQSVEDWHRDLERALDLDPDHVSLYALTIEEDTPFGKMAAKGLLQQPSDDTMADEYLMAHELLERSGYTHYEISNWAKNGQACRHNLTYWWNGFYLGFGAGAHSHVPGQRYYDVLKPAQYISCVESGRSPIAETETIGKEREAEDTLILGLRLREGVDLGLFQRRFGWNPAQRYADEVAELADAGLLEFKNETLSMTVQGWLLANEVFARLMAASSSVA